MITPKHDQWEVHDDAERVNVWNRKRLMNLPEDQRPTLDKAWEKFLIWLKGTRKSLEKPVIFCAYNGFKFDFYLLMIHLSMYGL